MSSEHPIRRLVIGIRGTGFRQRFVLALGVVVASMLTLSATIPGQNADDAEEPELTLRATPRVAFPPAEILFIAELRGGADDHEPLYCASVEWDWDDDTRSERIPDCDPFESGTSEIRRRFSQRHTFQNGGSYDVRINLKKRDEVVLSARTAIVLRGGRTRE